MEQTTKCCPMCLKEKWLAGYGRPKRGGYYCGDTSCPCHMERVKEEARKWTEESATESYKRDSRDAYALGKQEILLTLEEKLPPKETCYLHEKYKDSCDICLVKDEKNSVISKIRQILSELKEKGGI